MITHRKANERGRSGASWLDSRHTFSFAEYHDPAHMGFRALRVINDDRIAPDSGFGTHAHRDMEIVTYVLDGALQHRDSLGNGSLIRPGEIQRMSAGTGIRHSEINPSPGEPVRLLQIWILPERAGLPPGYEQKPLPPIDGTLALIASRNPGAGAVTIHQDVDLFAARLAGEQRVEHSLRPGRHAWLQIARGDVALNGLALAEGDGAAVSAEPRLEIAATSDAEILLFDLA